MQNTSMQQDGQKRGSAVRTIGTMLPLAVALAGGALHHTPPTPPSPATATISAPASGGSGPVLTADGSVPLPLLKKGQAVQWWFVFKLNHSSFPLCGEPDTSAGADTRGCTFGGTVQKDGGKVSPYPFGQRFVYASSSKPNLEAGGAECMGTSTDDPVGATFDEVYNGHFHYLIWNDQFHDVNPSVQNCSTGDCGAPWGHSKGMLAWNDSGEGFVMQVSTPSWPGSGNPKFQRAIGNTLGCIKDDDNIDVSQHFFALHLTKADLLVVLRGLQEASVATNTPSATGGMTQYADIGGPADVVAAAQQLGTKSKLDSMDPAKTGHAESQTLSSGVKFIAKPSLLPVPPWQMVSSVLGGIDLRVASWWASPKIYSTSGGVPGCWDNSLKQAPGAVDIATSGTWAGVNINLIGNPSANHAKVGVATSGTAHYAIFGDENQQGSSDPKDNKCDSSQNGRGGTFFAVDSPLLAGDLTNILLHGASAPLTGPPN